MSLDLLPSNLSGLELVVGVSLLFVAMFVHR